MTRQLAGTFVAGMATVAVSPAILTAAVLARASRGEVAAGFSRVAGAIIVATSAFAEATGVVARMVVVSTGGTVPEGHHLGHLFEERMLASSERSLTAIKKSGGVGNSGGRRDDRLVRGHSVKDTLGNEIGDGGDGVGLVGRRLLMKEVTSSGESTEVALGVTKMREHVGPGAFDGRATIPETEIVLEDRLASKDDIGHVKHLLRSHGGGSMFRKIREIVDGVEDGVDRLGNVVEHVVGRHFLGLDLLRRDSAISGKEMLKDRADVSGVLAGDAVEKRFKVDRVDGRDNLSDEGFFSGLTEIEGEFEFTPDIFGGFDLWASAVDRRVKGARITRSNPRDGIG